jgi:hypothetical protein
MTAIVLPDIDLDELRKSIPSLAEIDLPSLGKAGAKADEAIDSWRGKSRGPSWPWVAAGVFVVGLIGTLVALVSWSRRSDALAGADLPAQPYGGETYGTESVTTESWPSTESTPA